MKMSVILVIIIAVCVALVSISYPLSQYVSRMEDGADCMNCDNRRSCFARKKIYNDNEWLDEFMLLSWLRIYSYCKAIKKNNIKAYVVTALVTTILVLILFWSRGYDLTGVVFGVSTTMLFGLAIVDWNTQYIPFEYTIIIFICGLIQLFADFSNWYEYAIGLIAVSGFLLLVNKIGTLFLSKKYEDEEITSVIGDGDIKLMAATGLLLGWKLNFLALAIGCISGSVIHILRMKIKGSSSVLALGPYLSLGVYITMICGEQLISWYLNMLGVRPY